MSLRYKETLSVTGLSLKEFMHSAVVSHYEVLLHFVLNVVSQIFSFPEKMTGPVGKIPLMGNENVCVKVVKPLLSCSDCLVCT